MTTDTTHLDALSLAERYVALDKRIRDLHDKRDDLGREIKVYCAAVGITHLPVGELGVTYVPPSDEKRLDTKLIRRIVPAVLLAKCEMTVKRAASLRVVRARRVAA